MDQAATSQWLRLADEQPSSVASNLSLSLRQNSSRTIDEVRRYRLAVRHAGFSVTLLVAGLPLLVLWTVRSTYLGLMITRGMRLLEAVLGVGVMLGLMAVSVLVASERVDLVSVIALEVFLAVLAVVLRSAARRRWTQIDWMLCRRDRALSGRGA